MKKRILKKKLTTKDESKKILLNSNPSDLVNVIDGNYIEDRSFNKKL